MVKDDAISARGLSRAFARGVVFLFVIPPVLLGSIVAYSTWSPSNSGFAFHSAFVDEGAAPTLAPGTTTTFSVRYRNVGLATWVRGQATQVSLGVRGDSKEFADAGIAVGWLSPTRIATTAEEFVFPGMIGTFSFTVRAPTTPGVYRVPLRPVAEGFNWLEDEGVVLRITSDLGFHSQL